jgi:hypothetical protein
MKVNQKPIYITVNAASSNKNAYEAVDQVAATLPLAEVADQAVEPIPPDY